MDLFSNIKLHQIKKISEKVNLQQCIQKFEELGIHRRFRSKIDYLKVVVTFSNLSKILETSIEMMNFLLFPEEIEKLKFYYQQKKSSGRKHLISFIASQLYIRDLRFAFEQCKILVKYRSKEAMLDLLCMVWFNYKVPIHYEVQGELMPDTECPICLNEIQSHMEYKKLKCHCKYWYHGPCLEKWMEGHLSCPMCRFLV